VVSSFLLPLLYLTAMGVVWAAMSTTAARSDALGGLTYLDYIAPGLLAATAMQTAVGEGMWPVMTAFKWQKTYHAMVATPLRPRDILSAHLGFVAFRLSRRVVSSSSCLPSSARSSPGRVRSPPYWCRCSSGWRTRRRSSRSSAKAESPDGFSVLYRLGIMPMFLFSGAFFPVSQLPEVIAWLAYLTPLWHGVDSPEWSAPAASGAACARTSGVPLALAAHRLVGGRAPVPPAAWSSGLRWPPTRQTGPGDRRPPHCPADRRGGDSSSATSWSTAQLAGVPCRVPRAGVLPVLDRGRRAGLVGDFTLDNGTVIGYTAFVAPGMLAASAMNGALYDATYNIFFKMKYAKLTTPSCRRRCGRGRGGGEIAWALLRGTCYSAMFIAVMVVMGLTSSAWAVLALPAAMLVSLAFGGRGMALTTWMRSWQDFEFVTLAMLPMFLFSGDLLPALDVPPAVQWLVEVTPLYQGVALMRDLTTGAVGPADLVHVGYLAVIGGAGLLVASRRLGQLLLK
jgi:lipooligosaccharide transport system permease protein